MFTESELILKLASTTIFDTTTEYFKAYIELILKNLTTKKEKFKTNRHHIIPRCYFKIKQLPVDNSSENIVNLQYADHLLAHYYLGNCIIDPKIKIGMLRAMQYMHITKENINSIIMGPNATHWYEDLLRERGAAHSSKMRGNMPVPWNKGGGDCYTPEQRQKLHNNLVNLHTKYWLGKSLPTEMKNKISQTLTGNHLSETTRKKISETHKLNGIGKGDKNGMYNTKYMTNGIETIIVKNEDVKQYILKGYKFGKLTKLKNLNTGEIYVSIEDAATALGVTKNRIYKLLARKKNKILQRL